MSIVIDHHNDNDYKTLLANITLSKKENNKLKRNRNSNSNSGNSDNSGKSNSSNCKQDSYDIDIDIDIDIVCRDCESRNIDKVDGFHICKDCGLFNDCIIDSGQEWRCYGADDNKGNDAARCDIPTNELLPKTSIGSLVGFGSRENKTSKRIRNMNYWNAIPYRESSLLETFNNITIMSQNSGISQCIIEEAKIMYKKVTDIKSSRRTKKEAMKAGSVMLACKLKGVPRNCSEIAVIFKLKNNKTFRKSIKTFEEIWNNIQLLEKGIKNTFTKKTTETDLEEDDTSDEDTEEDTEDEDTTDEDDEKDGKEILRVNTIKNTMVKYTEPKKMISMLPTIPTIPTIHTKVLKPGIVTISNVSAHNKDNDNHMDSDKCITSSVAVHVPVVHKVLTKEIPIVSSKTLQECITKLHRFSCILGFNDKTFESCRLILTHVENEKYLDKHTPLSRTSAIIYYVIERLNISINKHHILQTCEVSDVTINKCYIKLMKYKKELSMINISM